MGFFSSITNVFKTATKAVATGGLSLIAPKLIPKSINNVLNKVVTAQFPSTPQQLIGTGVAAYTGNPSLLAGNFTSGGGSPKMALNLGQLLGTVGGILGSTNQTNNSYVSGLSQALQIGGSLVPVKTVASSPMTSLVSSAAKTVALPAVVSKGLTKEIVTAGSKVLARLGIPVYNINSFSSLLKRSIGSIASLARRTPSGTIVSILIGLGLTVLEANLLTAWHSQRRRGRRMNPANSKALRRAARRIRGFHKLCQHVDLLKTRGRSRVGRCGSCKKSPCRC